MAGHSSGKPGPTDPSQLIHLRSIEVRFKTSREKSLSVRVKIDDGPGINSRLYKKEEEVVWAFEERVASTSKLKISVRERNLLIFKRKIALFLVDMKELQGKPIEIIEQPGERQISLKIECEAAGPFIDLIRRLVEESQNRLSSMKVFLDRLGRVCEVLNRVSTIAEPVAEIHPAVGAAVSAVTMLYEASKRQQEVHEAATNLMEDIASFIPFTEMPVVRIQSKLAERTAYDMLVLFEKAARSIIRYSSDRSLGDLLSDNMEEINSYKEEFRKLKETFDWCIKTEVWRSVLKIDARTEQLILSQLHPSLSAFYDAEKSCFKGTRKEALQTIAEWSASDSKLLWIYGAEGTGKTTISHAVADALDRDDRLAACFFCHRNYNERRQAEKVIPTLAYQLAKWHADYRSVVLDVLEGRDERSIHTGLGAQFELLFKSPLEKLSQASPTVSCPPKERPLIIVVDALDECCDSIPARRLLAGYIRDIASLVPWLKVFVNSKKTPELEDCFVSNAFQRVSISDPPFDLQREIALYAEQSYVELSTPDGDLVTSATGDSLSIDELFRSFIRGIADKQRHDTATMPLAINILASICCITLHSALTEDALLHFLKPLHPEPDVIRSTISSLRPLVFADTARKLHVIFPLALFLDFISDPSRSRWFCADMGLVTSTIAFQCLDAMRTLLHFNICNLETSYVENKAIQDLDSTIGTNVPECLWYSCLYWMEHVLRAEDTQELREAVAEMLNSPRVLFWIEALSLINALDAGSHMLLSCAERFTDEDGIVAIATELASFINDFRNAIETSTPHLYVSALSWQTPDSLVYRKFGSAFRLQSPVIEEDALESAKSRDFWVVRDVEGRDWNPATFMNAIRYSPDGSRIVSGREDGSILLWDANTGTHVGDPVKGHNSFVSAVGYSPDGSRIVSGSEDGVLRIWDATNCAPAGEPFEVNAGSISAVEYSPDGNRIVSAGSTLQIWDARTCEPVCEPRWIVVNDRCYNINIVRYTTDGSRIVSGSFDRMVRIWNGIDGLPLGFPLRGHVGSVNAVAFSPDGTRIVSGSDDCTLIIWDAISGERIGDPLRGHETSVTSVEYSADGSRIISGSPDGAVRIWNSQSGAKIDLMVRGEEHWCSERQCYVALPNWWPQMIAPTLRSILPSFGPQPGPLEMGDDGWVRTSDGCLMLWVPLKYRSGFHHLNQTSTASESPQGRLKLDWRNICRGRSWIKVLKDVSWNTSKHVVAS